MVIKFEVHGQELMSKTRQKLVEKSSNFIECEFDFDSSWKDLTCLALFLPDGEKAPIPVIIQNNRCVVPNKLSYYGGYCKLAVVGGNGEFSDSVLNGDIISLDNTIASTNTAILMIEKTLDYSSVVADEELNSNLFTILNQISKIGTDVKYYWDEINNIYVWYQEEPIAAVVQFNDYVELVRWFNVNNTVPNSWDEASKKFVELGQLIAINDNNLPDLIVCVAAGSGEKSSITSNDEFLRVLSEEGRVKIRHFVFRQAGVKDAAYVHTDNNFTTEEKEKLDAIENKAQVNKIEKILLGDTECHINENTKTVTIPVHPDKLSDFNNDAGFVTQADIDGSLDPINSEISTIKEDLEITASIAKGANEAIAFKNYEMFIEHFNDQMTSPETGAYYNVGQNIMIETLEVPDLWVSEHCYDLNIYTYASDEAFVKDLKTNGFVHVGFYKFSQLETQKVDLTQYPTTKQVNDVVDAMEKELDDRPTHTEVKQEIVEIAPFVVNIISDFGEIIIDQTYDDIVSALDNGKSVIAHFSPSDVKDNQQSAFAYYEEHNKISFLFNADESFTLITGNRDNTWTEESLGFVTKERMDNAIQSAISKIPTSTTNNYELIKTITTGEDGVTTFTFNVDDNGNSFKLDALIMIISSPETPTSTSRWRLDANISESPNVIFYQAPNSKGKRQRLKAERVTNGYWYIENYRTFVDNVYDAYVSPGYSSMSAVDYITKLILKMPEAPVGTAVKIYGRRVSE